MTRRWPLLLGVFVLLGFALVAAAMSSVRIGTTASLRMSGGGSSDTSDDRPGVEVPNAPGGAPPEKRHVVGLDPWLVNLVVAFCVTVVVVVVLVVLWFVLRDTLRVRKAAVPVLADDRPAPDPERVRAAVDAGLEELDEGDADPRRAIIACWVRLERVAAMAGTPRQPSDTATDLVLRLLDGHRVSAPVLGALAGLYREARYATHPVDERMRADARSALHRLRAELTASAGLATNAGARAR